MSQKKNVESRIKSFDIFEKLPDEMSEGTIYGKISKSL